MHTDTIFSLNIIKTQLEIFLNTWHNILRESINISVLKTVLKLVIYEEMCLIKKVQKMYSLKLSTLYQNCTYLLVLRNCFPLFMD